MRGSRREHDKSLSYPRLPEARGSGPVTFQLDRGCRSAPFFRGLELERISCYRGDRLMVIIPPMVYGSKLTFSSWFVVFGRLNRLRGPQRSWSVMGCGEACIYPNPGIQCFAQRTPPWTKLLYGYQTGEPAAASVAMPHPHPDRELIGCRTPHSTSTSSLASSFSTLSSRNRPGLALETHSKMNQCTSSPIAPVTGTWVLPDHIRSL